MEDKSRGCGLQRRTEERRTTYATWSGYQIPYCFKGTTHQVGWTILKLNPLRICQAIYISTVAI